MTKTLVTALFAAGVFAQQAWANNLAFPPLEPLESENTLEQQQQYTPQTYHSRSTPSYFKQPRYVFPELENPVGENPLYSRYNYPANSHHQEDRTDKKVSPKIEEYNKEKERQDAYHAMLENYYMNSQMGYGLPTYGNNWNNNGTFNNSWNPFNSGFGMFPGFGNGFFNRNSNRYNTARNIPFSGFFSY